MSTGYPAPSGSYVHGQYFRSAAWGAMEACGYPDRRAGGAAGIYDSGIEPSLSLRMYAGEAPAAPGNEWIATPFAMPCAHVWATCGDCGHIRPKAWAPPNPGARQPIYDKPSPCQHGFALPTLEPSPYQRPKVEDPPFRIVDFWRQTPYITRPCAGLCQTRRFRRANGTGRGRSPWLLEVVYTLSVILFVRFG